MASDTLSRVLHGRWCVLAVGIVVLLVSSGAYSFSVYSQKLKTSLRINQESLNIVANFKDLGVNFGLFSGLLYDYWSPSGVLFLGAVETATGYILAWLAIRGKIPPSLWSMCIYQFLGANSQAMLNTAVLVRCVHLFPGSKGAVIALLKGYIGVSGAVLVQVYSAVCGVDAPESFLLLLVWLPSAVALISILAFRRSVAPFRGIPDARWFYWLLALGLSLAVALMAVSVARNVARLGEREERAIGEAILALVVLPLAAVTYRAEIHGKKSEDEAAPTSIEIHEKQSEDEAAPGFIACAEKSEDLQVTDEKPDVSSSWPRRGEDHTILQTFRTLDFWLLFIATTFGIGSGLTVTDNLGQLGLSLRYSQPSVRTFVSLVSIWNAIGRWTGGFLSDYLLRRYGATRPLFLSLAMALMSMSLLLIALALPGCLYFGSILLGLSFGAQYPCYATIVADLFGLKYYATLYSSIGMASPVGMYILSVPVVGRFYDAEAKGRSECLGKKCFGGSVLVLMGVTLGAAGCAVALWARTRGLYRQVHEEYQRKANPACSEAELAAKASVDHSIPTTRI